MRSVKMYTEEGETGKYIGQVPYTDNLDCCGHSGTPGRHLGVGTMGETWYVCYGCDIEGTRDYAIRISKGRAKAIVLERNPDVYEELFGEPPEVLSA